MLDSPYPQVIPGPPRPSRILTPTGFARQSGRERHVVQGGGAVILTIGQGDTVQIINDEGAQPCEIVAAGPDGQSDAGILGTTSNSTADGLKTMLVMGEFAGQGLGNAAQVQRGAVTFCRRPIEDELDALANAARCFGTVQPDREQHVAYGRGVDQVNAGVA